MDGVTETIMKKCLIWLLPVIVLTGCGKVESSSTSFTSEAQQEETSESEMVSLDTEIIVTEDASVVATEPVPSPPATFSIIMVGDILLHDPVEAAALQEDGSYNYEAIFTHMTEDIQAADLAIVNQEVIIGGEELGISGYPAFNAAFSAGDALVNAGFDVVCHGTNHALDKGRKGL